MKRILFLSLLTLGMLSSCGETKYLLTSYAPDIIITDKEARNTNTIHEIFKQQRLNTFPSLGTQKMLVIPVEFKGYQPLFPMLSRPFSSYIDKIEQCFFGETVTDSKGYEIDSVSSFYNKSSYGKLDIQGTIAPIYNPTLTYQEVERELKSERITTDRLTSMIAEDAVTQTIKTLNLNIKDYDSNGDSYIDGVWLVNNLGIGSSSETMSDLHWAFTNWDSQEQKESSAKVGVYAWASYEFSKLNTNTNLKTAIPDPHTYIHETGHMLGLDDYYDYDERMTAPLGKLDMMDLNIGDHNAYSKYLLGWISPSLVVNEGEIKLHPFQESGEAIIISSNWSGEPYDEYLILEYYTPTKLNKLDADIPYDKTYQMFTIPGIRVLHVNSSLYKVKESFGIMTVRNNYQEYHALNKDEVNNRSSTYYTFSSSNTKSRSFSDKPLLSLVNSQGADSYNIPYAPAATNDDLFISGEDFGITNNKKFKFNNSSKAPYGFYVSSLNSSEATIKFIKK